MGDTWLSVRTGAGALVLLWAIAPWPVAARAPADPASDGAVERALVAGGAARVREIVDGDTLVLDDERQVRLVGIQAPKLPLGRTGFRAWPLAEAAKSALSALTLGRTVRLAYGGARMDRHGRVLAHLFGPDGVWVQGALLARGLARVYSFVDNRAAVAPMLARERAARGAGRGIWAASFYRVGKPAAAARPVGTLQLVEGRVLDVAIVRGRAYLNFGSDWRSDFTVTLAPRTRRMFQAAGIDPTAYRGRRVRVRGWLKSFNGPMIEATHPEQIEVLDK
ncbi:MAG: thermonuclease family protein [Kiloniellaceae bacterium]